MIDTKQAIVKALGNLAGKSVLYDSARVFYRAMGYQSDIFPTLSDDKPESFFSECRPLDGYVQTITQSREEIINDAKSLQIVFQLAGDHITNQFSNSVGDFDAGSEESFLFVVADLKDERRYSRGKYARMTREISKYFPMPVFVLFRCGNLVSLAFADRRDSKRPHDNRKILGRVFLVREINCQQPHAGHLNILDALSLSNRKKWMQDNNQHWGFAGLHKALLSELDAEELNNKFYDDLFRWFEWAVKETKFPSPQKQSKESHVIRLITRMLFIWFIKEKDLVADELFNEVSVKKLLKNFDGINGDNYYRAILQNLFFATLNTEIDKRAFSGKTQNNHRDFNLYRYRDLLCDENELRLLMGKTPFINGGLFDCLDSEAATINGGYRLDCFTDNPAHRKELSIPDKIFFDRGRGLFSLFRKYKFTVEENTPIDQDVALDPELLGKVFEKLLAAYVPETSENIRKKTGSYYTPREVVDYMVSESLRTYLCECLAPKDKIETWQKNIGDLLDFAVDFGSDSESFNEQEKHDIVQAIADIKVLDPAVGSGAFPMGVLHKLVLILSRLDNDNVLWRELQKKRAVQQTSDAFGREKDAQQREARLKEINNTFEYYSSDFGRKLFLVQNSIFGVDIQPMACQIAKLRFFISLAIEQEANTERDNNYGIKPLPNLETRFVATNTLLGVAQKGTTRALASPLVAQMERELQEIREKHFNANTRQQKLDCTKQFKKKQQMLADELKKAYWGDDEADKIAAWDPFDQNYVADWFDPEWMFGEKNGFDVVIGNPPYISALVAKKTMSENLRMEYKNQYRSAVGTYDIYILFFERSLSLLRKGIFLCFITPSKFLSAHYAREYRKLVIEKFSLEKLVDVSRKKVFSSASVSAVISLLANKPQNNKITSITFNEVELLKEKKILSLYKDNLWGLLLSENESIINKVISDYYLLSDISKVNASSTAKEADEYIEFVNSNEGHKFIINKTVEPYYSNWGDVAIKIKKEKIIKPYIDLSKISARRRDMYQKPKLIVAKLARNAEVVVDTKGEFASVNTNFIYDIKKPYDIRFLGAFINSQCFMYIYANLFNGLHMFGTYQFQAPQLRIIPIPKISESEQSPFIKLVDKIIAAKEKDSSADISQWQKEIDYLVYRLYGLTDEEIAIVEELANNPRV